MDINQLEVFLSVAREKSFSRAADTLNRTQPAVSQAIRRLESELGESLFDRSSKDGTLTAAGRVLHDFAPRRRDRVVRGADERARRRLPRRAEAVRADGRRGPARRELTRIS